MAMAVRIILAIFWLIMVLLTLTQFAGSVADSKAPAANKRIAGIIFIIGAPIFCAYTALSGLLDLLLPEGWEDDDDEGDKKV